MKENILKLTVDLNKEGFFITSIEVEASDLVRIKFTDLNGLELIANEKYVEIIQNDCENSKVQKIRKLVEKFYTIKDEVQSSENDVFNQLLNAS